MRRLHLLVACLLLVACGDSNQPAGPEKQPVEPEPISRVGIYSLRTVDGGQLPYAYPDAPGYELTAETLTLNADLTFIGRTDQRYTDGNNQVHTGSVSNSGTYTISGVDVTLRFSSGGVAADNFTGPDELTGHCCGSIWVYRR